jgi:hypothetical protein
VRSDVASEISKVAQTFKADPTLPNREEVRFDLDVRNDVRW